MDSWKRVLRQGFLPLLSPAQIEGLVLALQENDLHLVHGATSVPAAYSVTMDWPVTDCCLVSYPYWKSGDSTVGQLNHAFAEACASIDRRMGEPAAVRWLLNAWDETEDKVAFRASVLDEIRMWMEGGS